MRGIVEDLLAAFLVITAIFCLDLIAVGFHATAVSADEVDYETRRYEYSSIETMAQLDVAARFNVEVEDIDCEGSFAKPSFGKAYHNSGSVQDYFRAVKPDVLPDFHIRRTGYRGDSEHPDWSIKITGILCSLLLAVLLIIWRGKWYFRN